jgi:hypothetical protein
MTSACAPFPWLSFECILKVVVDDEQSKEDDHKALQCNFIFLYVVCVKPLFICIVNCFHGYENTFWCRS